MNILQSLFHLFIPVLTLNKNISALTISRWLVGPINQLGAMPIYQRCSLQILWPNSWLGSRYVEVGFDTLYYHHCLQHFLWKHHERDREDIAVGTFDIPNYISGQLGNIIHQILTVSPEKKPSIEDIERHSWVKKHEINIPTMNDPVSNIMDMLCGMEFNSNEMLKSWQMNKYDEKWLHI